MILKWNEFLLESNKKDWFVRNAHKLVTTEVSIDDLYSKYLVPTEIVEEMKKWPVIMKSPLSSSFYSSKDTSLNSKPDGSLRASDHWNFTSSSDGKLHCKSDIPVRNNAEWCIGKFDLKTKSYKILLKVDCPIYLDNIERKKEKERREKERLTDPERIKKLRFFKQKIRNHEITCILSYNGTEYNGIVDKYTGKGGDIRIVDDKGNLIFTKSSKVNKVSGSYSNKIELFDNGTPMIDPFKD